MKLDNRVGETNIAKNGMKMTIIAYRQWNDIDVQFEDGYIAYHKAYKEFKNGAIKNPNVKKKRPLKTGRIGQSKIMNCGMKCTCIAYRSSEDADFQFEDGTIVTNKYWVQFERMGIMNPSLKESPSLRANESKRKNIENRLKQKVYTTKYGMTYRVIEYIDSTKVIIEFEDGYRMEIQSQRLGENIIRPDLIIHSGRNGYTIIKVGETRIMNCGEEATIINATHARDITVQFKSGTIKEHVRYSDFIKGNISKITIGPGKSIGDSFVTKNGEKFTIISKKGKMSIIKFQTGETRDIETKTIRDGIDITSKKKTRLSDEYNGVIFDTICGLKFKVLKWIAKNTVKGMFEDGLIREDVNVQVLKTGNVAHPDLKSPRGFNMFYGYKIKKLMVINHKTYYGVYDDMNEMVDVKTPQEIIKEVKGLEYEF